MPAAMPDAPPARESHRTTIQMRFSDTDALGHVNNTSFALYAEAARLDFLQRLGGAVGSLILAHLSIDFRRQVAFGAAVQVDSWVERVGTTSVTIGQAILANGETAAEVRSVVVLFDYESQRPRPISAEGRALLAPFVVAVGSDRTPGEGSRGA